MNTINLKAAPTREQTDVLRRAPGRVDRTGGMYQAGLIERASIITRGEALGHGAWIDSEMLEQVSDGLRSAGESGLKARFKHPGISSDGTGKLLGRINNPSLEGDQVLADIHFAESAHDTPDGDLAGYVLSVAEETPDLFGTSIVFSPDREAQKEHSITHGATEERDEFGTFLSYDDYVSPDELNTKNLPHARVAELFGADVVDEPAANPSGMFSAELGEQEAMIASFEALFAYCLGIDQIPPQISDHLPVHPDRAKRFAQRFLANRGLSITNQQTKNERNCSNYRRLVFLPGR